MTCQDFADVVIDLLRQEGPPDRLAAAERHVAECSRCAEIFVRERRLSAALREAMETTVPPPPAGALDRLADELRAARPRPRVGRWATAAAALIAAGAALWLATGTPPAETPPPAEAMEFYVLNPAAPMELRSGRLVRLEVPRDALAGLGLPPPPAADPVFADVWLGDDGIARAVRFVEDR